MRSPSNALIAVALAAVLGIALSAHTTTAPAGAQQKPIDVRDKKEFRSGSELVTTAVTVRDQEGRLITDLEAKDFTVEEDGVAQPITQFSTERVPISLTAALDISDSMAQVRASAVRVALDDEDGDVHGSSTRR